MELRDFVGIFWKQRVMLAGIVFVNVFCGGLFFWLQEPTVSADLTLNIGRKGVQQTTDYRYDGFYRLQADERFADTVVRWLGSARVVENISHAARASFISSRPFHFGSLILAERLSSQVVHVVYRANTSDEANRLAKELVVEMNRETEQLNPGANDESQFMIRADAPVLSDGRLSLITVTSFSLAFGIFVSFWTGLIRWYWK